jgi:8-oxo-dGTP pyrophosphatase MutT (NUDIX family)
MTMKTEQVGALCVRRQDDGSCQVLLVTSRDTGRWIIPKGWKAKRLEDHEAAAREAEEEAGVSGKVTSEPIGNYTYPKIDGRDARTLRVAVYLLLVQRIKDYWPEQSQRRRAWFDVHEAIEKVQEPRLRTLIQGLRQLAPA